MSKELIRSIVSRQLTDSRFAEFCVTHVTDPKYSFLFNTSDPNHEAYGKELAAALAGHSTGVKRPRCGDSTSSSVVSEDDAVYNSLREAAEKISQASEHRSGAHDIGRRPFYFATRADFDVSMALLRRAIGWGDRGDTSSEAAMEEFVVHMFRRRTRTLCFLQLLAAVSLLLWREEQRRLDLQCHVRRANVFFVAAMLLLRHLEHLTIESSEADREGGGAKTKRLLYANAFEKHLPLITSLGAQRCATSTRVGSNADALAASDECSRQVVKTVQSFADGKMLPEALVAKLHGATRTVIATGGQ